MQSPHTDTDDIVICISEFSVNYCYGYNHAAKKETNCGGACFSSHVSVILCVQYINMTNAMRNCVQGPVSLTLFPRYQNQWQFPFSLMRVVTKQSRQNFAHDTTAVMSCHLRKCVAIWWPMTELEQNEPSLNLNNEWKSLVKWSRPGNNTCRHSKLRWYVDTFRPGQNVLQFVDDIFKCS